MHIIQRSKPASINENMLETEAVGNVKMNGDKPDTQQAASDEV